MVADEVTARAIFAIGVLDGTLAKRRQRNPEPDDEEIVVRVALALMADVIAQHYSITQNMAGGEERAPVDAVRIEEAVSLVIDPF